VRLFEVEGVRLAVPEAELGPRLRHALETGRYEHAEAHALATHLRSGDRVLDLGAGCGYLTIVAARIVGPDAVTAVEPNPALLPVIVDNVAANGLPPVRVLHGAAVAGPGGGQVALSLRAGFWAGSTVRDDRRHGAVDVPALGLAALQQTYRPTVLVADVEGAEEALFDAPLPPPLRLVIVELHPNVYGARGIARVFAGFAASGFAYCPSGSRGRTIVFHRLEDVGTAPRAAP
jgi:FkbM family methyltransferase